MKEIKTFFDLDDYGREAKPDFTTRVWITLWIDGPEEWDFILTDGVNLIRLETLSERDQKQINGWINAELTEYAADRVEYAKDRGEL